MSKLEQLFAFLQENVSNASTFKAAEVELLPLKDWSEEVHTRRKTMRLPNGTVMHQLQSFAWETSSQNRNPHLLRPHPAAVRPVRRSERPPPANVPRYSEVFTLLNITN